MAGSALEFGIKLPNLSPLASRDAIVSVARTAERSGYASLWASDHVVFSTATTHDVPDRRFPVDFTTPALDPLVALSVAAGVTEHVLLGTSVLVLATRNPVVTAKMWASLEHLAPSRVIAGIGTGWQEREFSALGAGDRFPRRGQVTEEFIDIMRTCWTVQEPTFHGRHYSFDRLHFHPQPSHPIPILLGASSERGKRRVARAADGFHGTNLSPQAAAQMVGELRAMAEEAGRDPDALLFTTLCELDLPSAGRSAGPRHDIDFIGSRDQLLERSAAFEEAGITHIALRVRALSGSTRRGVENRLSLSEGLDVIQRFAEEVLPPASQVSHGVGTLR